MRPRRETEPGNGLGGVPSTSTATVLSGSSTAAKPEMVPGQAALGPDPFVGRVLSHYRLEERLGAGGMGVLYRATDLKLGRAVAIKLLARHLISDDSAKARFVREARAASALDHPNIANVHDIGEEEGELFIVMALYEGETLQQRLAKGRLAIDEAVAILRQVALGLEAAHRAGIVHRDIKPANVLLTSGGTVKILDFGLAKLVSDSQAQAMTQAGQAMGTVLYMSPEQLRGEPVDSRSDVWSLGVLAYEVLAGVSPFQTDSSAATAMRILNDEPSSLASVPGVPNWLAKLVSQLLRKNPAERPKTASEILRLLNDGNPASQPEPRTLPTRASPRDARLAYRQIVLVIAAGLLVVAVAWWGLRSRTMNQGVGGDRSIAVLPFASLSSGEENAYFAQGFHDELLRQMGSIGDLRVISRTSVMQYKEGARNSREIAEALGVSSIVEGSVQRDGHRVRVEARLIDARNDRQMWGARYDRDVTDIFGIQTAVAEEIAGALHARLAAAQKAQIERKPTLSADAYDLYLRALEYANRPGYQSDNLGIAERFYRQAIQADPSFALARARLAYVRMMTYWFVAGTPDALADEAREEAEKALKLQPDLADAHLALGTYHYARRRDYDRALAEFEIARAGIPAEATLWIGAIKKRQGRFDEAIRTQQEAVRLDPRSPDQLRELAFLLMWTRKYEEADQVINRMLTIAPDYLRPAIMKAIVQEAWKGETGLAKQVLREVRGRLDPRGRGFMQDWISHILAHNPHDALVFLDSLDADSITTAAAVYPKAFLYAVAHEALGDAARARREYQTALPALEAEVQKHGRRQDIEAYQRAELAWAYAGLDRKEDALREASRAIEIMPISIDTIVGRHLEIYRALVEARIGETDTAIEHIRELLSVPCLLSPGLLRVDPRWAPLRNDPRFRKLAELERG